MFRRSTFILIPNIHFLSFLFFNSAYTTDESHHRNKTRSIDSSGHYDTGTWYSKPMYQSVFKCQEDPPCGQSRTGQATPPPLDPTRVLPTLVGKSDKAQTSPLSNHKSRRH